MTLITALFALCVPAAAQDATIPWRPAKDHDAALAESKKYGIPLLIHFTGKNAPGVKDFNTALEHPALVEAAARFIPVVADIFSDKAVFDRHSNKMFPSLYVLGPDASKGEIIFTSKPERIVELLEKAADTLTRGPKWLDSITEALDAGMIDEKLVLLVFSDGTPKSADYLKSFGDAVFGKLFEGCAAVTCPVEKDSDECKTWEVTDSPVLLLVDPREAKPKVIKRIKGLKAPKELKKEIDEALKKFEKKK